MDFRRLSVAFPSYRLQAVVVDFATDRRGWVWLTTSKDARAFDGQHWTSYNAEQIGFTRTVEMIGEGVDFWLTEVVADDQGDVWVADCTWIGESPSGQGARQWVDGPRQRQDSTPVASGCIYDMELAAPGYLWVGVNGDLWRYTPGQNWTKFDHPPVDPTGQLRWGFITDITLDEMHNPWVTVHRCGGASCETDQYALFQIIGGAWTPILEMQGERIGDIAFAWGEAWVCADSGLYRVKDGTALKIAGDEFAFCRVEADYDGRVWLTQPGQAAIWLYPGP